MVIIKNRPDTPFKGNGPIKRVKVEESIFGING